MQDGCEFLGINVDITEQWRLAGERRAQREQYRRLATELEAVLLAIADGGTVGMSAFPFDGEGVPSAENTLVQDGVFKGFLYDTYYGRVLGEPSTGALPPLPRGVRVHFAQLTRWRVLRQANFRSSSRSVETECVG